MRGAARKRKVPPSPALTRVILIVLDSVGIGELPDAAAYGDEGSHTLGNIARHARLRLPTLATLGLGRLVDLPATPAPATTVGAFGRMAERSPGKDSVTGHWELMGLVLDRPFPVFPRGFPPEVISEFERRIGRPVLGNVAASGTQIIEDLGAAHVRTGRPIVYTSADSVFQIAAHESVIPIPELYRFCEIAYDLVVRGHGVGRVIARPFIGEAGAFTRTANRHDYAMPPTGETLLDRLSQAGWPVVSVGKVGDLFAGKGITRATPTRSDAHGLEVIHAECSTLERGLLFANLVDSDVLYGHRNDPAGYAANLEAVDAGLAALLPRLRPSDVLVVTADHGNDPTTASTDHSREYVPVLAAGAGVRPGTDLGVRATFADLGQTLAQGFGVGPLAHGESFLRELTGGHGGPPVSGASGRPDP
jgi:phosphopentomutase